MNWLIAGIAVITALVTFIGGMVVFRFRKTLPYFFAFAAGNLIAVSFFDIQPQTFAMAQDVGIPILYVMVIIVGAFFLFHLLERYLVLYHTDSDDFNGHIMGPVGAGGLTVNSFLDGMAIGIAFQASVSIGVLVGIAVILHDLTDGMNTVVIMLKNHQTTERSYLFLLADSLAPFLGIILASLVLLPQSALVVLLALFAGEFIYIGAASLLPETYRYPPPRMVLSMGLGILLILVLTLLIL